MFKKCIGGVETIAKSLKPSTYGVKSHPPPLSISLLAFCPFLKISYINQYLEFPDLSKHFVADVLVKDKKKTVLPTHRAL